MIITEVTQVLRRYYAGITEVTQVLRRCYGGVTEFFFPLRSSVTTRNFDTEVRNHMRDTS